MIESAQIFMTVDDACNLFINNEHVCRLEGIDKLSQIQ
jgi:hypothetical protein